MRDLHYELAEREGTRILRVYRTHWIFTVGAVLLSIFFAHLPLRLGVDGRMIAISIIVLVMANKRAPRWCLAVRFLLLLLLWNNTCA